MDLPTQRYRRERVKDIIDLVGKSLLDLAHEHNNQMIYLQWLLAEF